MFEDRAQAERDRLSGATRLPGIIVTDAQGGTTSYLVILGKFSSRAQAERKAAVLADSSLVPQAQVMARPR